MGMGTYLAQRFDAGKRLFAGEVVDGDGIFEQRVVTGDDGDAAVGDEITLTVGLGVEAYGGAFRNVDVAVNDGAADAAVAADIDVREQDAGVDLAVGVDAHVGRDHAVAYGAAGDDAAGGDDRIERRPRAARFGKHEFGRRVLPLVGANRPVGVVEVEHRRHRDDVHVGIVERFERADVAPVERFLLVLIDEVEGVDTIIIGHARQDVFSEVVCGVRFFRVFEEHRDEHVSVEEINAHRGGDFFRVDGGAQVGPLGFLLNSDNPV